MFIRAPAERATYFAFWLLGVTSYPELGYTYSHLCGHLPFIGMSLQESLTARFHYSLIFYKVTHEN
jgi:hypothetical protein